MKKISLALCVSGLFTFASADLLSVSAGVGINQQTPSGYFDVSGNRINIDKNGDTYLGLKESYNPSVWVKFIYPIPILPNIKVEYTKYDSTGTPQSTQNIELPGGETLTLTVNGEYKQTINSYDVTLFYEFKPVFVDIEFGIGADYWDAKSEFSSDVGSNTASWMAILPYVYGHLESMQFFGFSALVDLKYFDTSGLDIEDLNFHHYDFRGALKYTIDILGPINPFIKVGYRYKDILVKYDGNEMNLNYSGAFAEIGAKF